MKTFDTLLKFISWLAEWVTCALLSALVLIISWQVFSRYALGSAPSWSEEISLILVVWFGLLGAGLGVRDGSHLAVEFMVRNFSAAAQRFFHRLSLAIVICFASLMTVAGFRLVSMVGGHGETNPATGIPVAVTYLAIPVAGIFIMLHAARHLVGLFSNDYEIAADTIEAEAAAGKVGDN